MGFCPQPRNAECGDDTLYEGFCGGCRHRWTKGEAAEVRLPCGLSRWQVLWLFKNDPNFMCEDLARPVCYLYQTFDGGYQVSWQELVDVPPQSWVWPETWWEMELRQVVLGTGTADLVESLMEQLNVAGLLRLSATCEQARHGSPRLQAALVRKYKASPLTGRVCRVRGDGSDWSVPNPRMLNGWQESRTASARIRLKAPQVYTICCGADGTGAETLWGSPRMTSRSERFRGIGGV